MAKNNVELYIKYEVKYKNKIIKGTRNNKGKYSMFSFLYEILTCCFNFELFVKKNSVEWKKQLCKNGSFEKSYIKKIE